MEKYRRPVALIVLDGFGLNPNPEANAVYMARTPNFDRYWAEYPHTTLEASGEAVGQLPGQMGDSNVGHLNLGAGRVVDQTLVRIARAIAGGSFFTVAAWQDAVARVKKSGGALHLMGLVSDGGVHSHMTHIFALVDMAKAAGIPADRLFLHAFLDGRDVPPTSAPGYLEQLEEKLRAAGIGRIASVSGRYYAMDRDRRWERTALAFRAVHSGDGIPAAEWAAAVAGARERGEKDEFVQPTVITDAAGQAIGPIRPGDVAIFFNFRPDRGRQLSRALFAADFADFDRGAGFRPVPLYTMTQYDQEFDVPVAFPPRFVTRPMGEVVSAAGLRQLRIAETEKYAHVTYFFNGGEEQVFPGEERVMIPSPKVATYDLQPEMSAYGVAAEAERWIREDRLDFMVLNFANPDMVGHTGVLSAAIRACEAVDECLGQVLAAIRDKGGAALVLADHGNADQMIDYATGQPHTNHTLHPVPCILVDDTRKGATLRTDGVLGNAAPTLLEVIGLPQPPEMDRPSLLTRAD